MNEKPKDEPPKDPLLLDHECDGVREYDNPLPRWWLYILYGTILYSALYWLNLVPGIGTGHGRVANYEREMEKARAQQQAIAARGGGALTETDLLAIVRDATRLAQGKDKFKTTCSPCHREDGGGSIGPNLTDDYWIHGGRPLDLLRTATEGVPDKGMPAWGQVLKPGDLASVVAYVITLHGTNPSKPKEPQGVKAEADSPEHSHSSGGPGH